MKDEPLLYLFEFYYLGDLPQSFHLEKLKKQESGSLLKRSKECVISLLKNMK